MGREVVEQKGKFAVRETVSDIEIITPWFDTKEALIDHLATQGDSWNSGPLGQEKAAAFVESGFVPSAMMTQSGFYQTYDIALVNKRAREASQ